MRSAVAISFICILAASVAGQPNATTNNKNTSAKKEKALPIGKHEDKSPTDTPHKTNDDPPRWYAPFERPDWWIVIIAALTGAAIVYQAKEMTKATNVMRDQGKLMASQTALMQVPYRQWLELADWKVDCGTWVDPISKLRITVSLVNPTSLPITILNGKIIFGDAFGDPDTTPQICRDIANAFLTPKTPYIIAVILDLDPQESLEFTNGNLRIHVRGKFSHSGPLGDKLKISQPLLGELACGGWGCEFHPIIHMNPKAEENQPQNQT